MPELDVSFMTEDPMFADTFTVTRRLDTVNSKGRTSAGTETVFPDVIGVVTQEEPDGLVRDPDGQRAPRKIFIATKFAVRGVSTAHQPDLITWNGTVYTVTEVLPYSRFGDGTYQVRAESTAMVDAAQ